MIRLADFAALDAWLDDRGDLHSAAVVAASRTVVGGGVVRLDVVVQPGREPGDIEIIETHELVAEAPAELAVLDGNEPPWWIDDAGIEELDGRLVLRIGEWPGRLTLTAAAFRTERVAVRNERVEPCVDADRIEVWPARDDHFWSERLTAMLGEPVLWRAHGSLIACAAGEDIDGCYLQRASALATSNSGVVYGRHGTWTHLGGSFDTDLGQAVRALTTEFERVRSGNCEFDAADWAAYLATGVFPPDERLRPRT